MITLSREGFRYALSEKLEQKFFKFELRKQKIFKLRNSLNLRTKCQKMH